MCHRETGCNEENDEAMGLDEEFGNVGVCVIGKTTKIRIYFMCIPLYYFFYYIFNVMLFLLYTTVSRYLAMYFFNNPILVIDYH